MMKRMSIMMMMKNKQTFKMILMIGIRSNDCDVNYADRDVDSNDVDSMMITITRKLCCC